MSNTPTLANSEEQRAPWNDNSQDSVIKDVTISVTYSKTVPMMFPSNKYAVENEEEYAEEQLREYDMLPLKNGRHNGWYEDKLSLVVE